MTKIEVRSQINKSGRIVIPFRLRKALGLQPGDEIVLRLESNSILLIPLNQAVRMAQTTVRRYIPEGVSLVDELLEARKEES